MSIPPEGHAYSQVSRDRTIHFQGDVSPVAPLETITDTDLGSVELMSPGLPQAPQANAGNQPLDGSPISVPLAGSNIDLENAAPADSARLSIATGDSIGKYNPIRERLGETPTTNLTRICQATRVFPFHIQGARSWKNPHFCVRCPSLVSTAPPLCVRMDIIAQLSADKSCGNL